MTITKAYKYRIYPNKVQESFLNQNFGAARYVWNALVFNFQNYGKEGYINTLSEKHMKSYNPWMKGMISYVLQQKRIDFQTFKTQFFNKKRKVKIGRPNFKKKYSNQSFRIPAQALGNHKCLNYIDGLIKITKISPIKCKFDRQIPNDAKIYSVTISKNKVGEYYASFSFETIVESIPKSGRNIGIDLGLTTLITLSDGTKFSNPKFLNEDQVKIKRAQRTLARKQKGSKRRDKAKMKLAKLHHYVTKKKDQYLHQVSNYLIHNYDKIVFEDLSVKYMMKNHKLARSIADTSWSRLVTLTMYKSLWAEKEVIKVNRFFASSKICSDCGYKLDKLDLSVREWECPSCGTYHDRDVNAARNIHKEALAEELPAVSRGEIISPSWFIQKANFDEAIRKSNHESLYGNL